MIAQILISAVSTTYERKIGRESSRTAEQKELLECNVRYTVYCKFYIKLPIVSTVLIINDDGDEK